MKFAAIDIGSNSVRYLAVEARGDEMVYLSSGTEVTRITEGIGAGQVRVTPEALKRTLRAIGKHLRSLEEIGVLPERRVFFGTESLRSASNAEGLRRELESAAGLPLEVLSGEDEGRLSSSGAWLSGLDGDMVFDLGGGSLEIQGPEGAVSLPLGAVRIKGLLGEDPLRIGNFVREHLGSISPGNAAHLIGVGGTSSSIAMMLSSLPTGDYHPSRLHGKVLARESLHELAERLRTLDAEGRRGVIGLEPKRADIIVAGLLVIEALLGYLGLESYRHSECDLLWGRLAEEAHRYGLPVRRVLFSQTR